MKNHPRAAKAYILYRHEHTKVREVKEKIYGVKDDLKMSLNAIKVLERRYLKKDDEGKVIETPKGMFERVAENIATADSFYDKDTDLKAIKEDFFDLMSSLDFLPNSPTLMNAGKPLQQLAGCFVIPVEDSMEGIFTAVKDMALVHQSGGGTGFSFSRLRPKNSMVRSTHGVASGPISFMKVFNASTEVVKQGGTRRGANMGILRIDHPDILDFITCKKEEGELNNFNISVAITDKFMEAAMKGEEYDLIDPKTHKPVKKYNAAMVFKLIVSLAWKNGEPGIIFIDKINAENPTPKVGEIESTNPCITGDTLVPTENGLERMEQVYNRWVAGEEVRVGTDNRLFEEVVNMYSSGLKQQVKQGTTLRPITNAINQGIKDVMKLTTKSGFEITATPDHKIKTVSGWKELKDLIPGYDKVLVQADLTSFDADEVNSIELIGERIVYDLTEPVTHSFIGNGIVISNCGEQPLLPYESCNLGSINLANMLKEVSDEKYEVDWNKLKEITRRSVHFMDNVIDMSRYPIEKIDQMVKANRKLGLGVMGFANMLLKLNIAYDSDEATELGGKIMKTITDSGREMSEELAKTRGAFPNFKGSIYDKPGAKPLRNATITTIAPTGTISIIA
ncbi:MAG: ribonucleotide reductase, partial [Candidatus Diapherotrites archaeon]|nr:ribonucleotide reductase [Candidatus Diapherotrites archaeon]